MQTALFFGNCQILTLYTLLKDLLIAHGIRPVHVQEVHLLTPSDVLTLEVEARNAEIFIGQHVIPKPGRPSSTQLAGAAKLRVHVPNAYFTGYHHHLQLLNTPHGRDTGCLAAWSLVRSGVEAEAVQDMLQASDAFNEGDILAFANQSLAELDRREKEFEVDVPLAAYIAQQWRERRLFHTANHPDRSVLLHVANGVIEVLRKSGYLSSSASQISDSAGLDRCFSSIDFIEHLLLPSVARALGVTDGVSTSEARITYRERFKLKDEAPTNFISTCDFAKTYRAWCEVAGWTDGIRANDSDAKSVPTVRSQRT